MPGPCSHQFVWPRRASDGRYYQICRHCEAEYEYDWESMSRLPSADPAGADTASTEVRIGQSSGGSTTTLTPEVMIRRVKVREVPPLKLLVEAEPAHSIFIQNLADLLRSRSPRLITAPSEPGSFLCDVFVPSGLPWWWFAESLLGHMILVTAVLILFRNWPVSGPIEQPNAFHKSYISYYTPPKSFPALGSHSPRVRAQTNRQSEPPRRPAIRVAPESTHTGGQKQSTLRPPDLMAAGSGRIGAKGLGIATAPPPMMPLSATGR